MTLLKNGVGTPALTFASLDGRLDTVESDVVGLTTTKAEKALISVNAGDYGYIGDGVADDTAAITDALAALKAYASGIGGGAVILPRTATGIAQISSAITLDSGQRIVGEGPRMTVIRGTVAGALITTPTDGGANPIRFYGGLENLFLINSSSADAARCLEILQYARFVAEGCTFQTAGDYMVRANKCNLLSFVRCKFGGVAGAELGLFLDANNNVNLIDDCSFTDSKNAIRAAGGIELNVVNSHFETLAGGTATYNAALAVSGFRGGRIVGNYFEGCVAGNIAFFSTIDVSYGFEVSNNFMSNPGSPGIDAAQLRNGNIGPNVIEPGATSPNANGVVANGSFSGLVAGQRLASGSGVAVTLETTIASATSITIPDNGRDIFIITGTTTINTIVTTGLSGRVITLVFGASLSMGTGGNLLLAGAAAFGATANDAITFAIHGSSCYEVCRSVN